ncbi:DNA-directed RNA polymerase, mitochondrial [Golovinomyces cichoracearum]|uniref:DNA-directed RNA polymerase n=1 Tax=Golovinomyces cichoracearum TaxID=62708 RepID=A0A420JAJ6_9PEZI|nr:DNA-directed RNA polymerase, mitochondrial [Golovinomyces cichoracearum]
MLVQAARHRAALQLNHSRAYYELNSRRPKSMNNVFSYRPTRFISLISLLQRHWLEQKKSLNEFPHIPNRRPMSTALSFTADDVPFEKLNSPLPSMMNARNSYGRPLVSPHVSSANVYDPSEKQGSQVFRRGRLGISGDISEIIPVFEACLHVGRFERARDILDKLLDKSITECDAIRCTNLYLRAKVDHLMMSPKNESHMQEVHKWFEINHQIKEIPHDSETIAYMLRLSLQSSKGMRERLVEQYMQLLDEESFLEMIEDDILTGHETSLITEIYPNYNFTLEPDGKKPDVKLAEDVRINVETAKPGPSKVLETKQKGSGLSTLKKNLSIFNQISFEGIDLNTASHELKRDLQRRLEEDAVASAIDRWREENEALLKVGVNPQLQNKSLGSHMWEWQVCLEKKIKKELESITEAEIVEKKSREDVDRCLYGPLLQILPPSQLSAITILSSMTMMGQHTDKRTPLSALVLEIGKNIEDESTLFMLKKNLRKKDLPPTDYKKFRLNSEFYMKLKRSRGAGAPAKFMNHIFAAEGSKPWPSGLKAKIGALLMSYLIDVAKVPAEAQDPKTNEWIVQLQPAFTHAHQYKKGKKTGVILLNKVILEKLKREPVHSLLAKQLPMIVRPEDWTGFKKGGYIAHPCQTMRIKYGDQDQRKYCEAAIAQGDMSTVFQGLNVLGKTPWRINNAVYEVMVEAWNTGEAIANFPPLNPQFEVPEEPQACTDPLERGRWIRKVKIIQNMKIGLHSQRCFQNFQLEIAQALRDKEFFFPHNIDFRGRAYPIPPYLNHIGADHCRGLLTFGIGKELGENGLRWLKIHLSNVFGYDKASLQEREEFSNSNIEEIYDSATRPMTGKRWWLGSENPWQCLAACIELKNALDCTDPKKYISHLPIHQDGTCNGLQHYAALGGDTWGAKQVNLEPGERPADVYTAVAELVRESIARDKKAGLNMAHYLDGKITRKTVKQTVMTNVYGVTFIGASAQVRKQLANANPDLSSSESANRQNASAYVARNIFSALSTMFRGAHDIQHWLGKCAARITTSISLQQILKLESEWENICNSISDESKPISGTRKMGRPLNLDEMTIFRSGVVWTSPLGMPVVQPYRTAKGKMVRTSMQNLNLSEPQHNSPVNKRKQLQGFPPNFIHSLDASHMILSAIGCDKLGLSFAAVHDSFWTHACNVDTMNNVLREKFIEIHNDDIIGRLAAEFRARYQNSMYLAKVSPGDVAHKAIHAWRVNMRNQTKLMFKSSRFEPKTLRLIHELILESKRTRLLSSSDPLKVQEGKEMETPGSIYEACVKEGDERLVEDPMELNHELSPEDETNISKLGDDLDSGEVGSVDDATEMNSDSIEASSEFDQDAIEDEANVNDAELEELSRFERALKKPPPKKGPKIDFVWLPLVIPEIPKKGGFDVSRLKNSKYFFS